MKEALIEVIYQPPTYKDKIYLFRKDQNWPKRRFNCSGRSRDDPADQGGAVVPDNGVATHELDL
jgi:hypothetical protein